VVAEAAVTVLRAADPLSVPAVLVYTGFAVLSLVKLFAVFPIPVVVTVRELGSAWGSTDPTTLGFGVPEPPVPRTERRP